MEFDQFDALVRGIGIGIVLLVGVQMARSFGINRHAPIGVLFCLGIAAYFICSAVWFFSLPTVVVAPIFALCILNPLVFWLFAQSLFDDQFALKRTQKVVVSGFILIGAVNFLTWFIPNMPFEKLLSTLQQVFSLGLIAHILFDVVRGHAGDLVELRRKVRTYAVVAIGAYILLVLVGEMTLAGEQPSDLLNVINIMSITLIALGVGSIFLQMRPELSLPNQPTSKPTSKLQAAALPETSNDEQQSLINAITTLFDQQAVYRQEGLTVANLAEQLHVPEYRVRRAINQGMGHRNFNSFLNHHRLAEIEAALSDPEKARLPILTVAFDAGFSSLAPFNKAFKERTGLTPTAFREQHAAKRHE